jgi:hypothetical protein
MQAPETKQHIFAGPKTVSVYSTLTNSQNYPLYERDPQGNAHIIAHAFIEGGAHRANKRIETPLALETRISEAMLEHLLQNHTFQQHMKAGRITYRKDQVDIEKAIADHNAYKDQSAPLTPEDYTEDAKRSNNPDEIVALPTTAGAETGKGRKVAK